MNISDSLNPLSKPNVAIGDRYCRLLVLDLIKDSKNPKAKCICDCGNLITPQRGALKNGRAKSCGCLRVELLAAHSSSVKLTEAERKKRKHASTAKWQKENKEKYRQINNKATRKFYKNNPLKAKENCQKRRARQLNAGGVVTKNIEKLLVQRQKWKCACCKTKLTNKWHLDHIYPLFQGGRHEDKNLQILCVFCNLSKGSTDPIKFMQKNGYLL